MARKFEFTKPLTIAIVGPHYAGKSLLCSLFKEQLGFTSIDEPWWQDPFRDHKPRDYFRSQLWFLTQRLAALNQAKELNRAGTGVVLDTFYFSTLIFGATKLNEIDQQVFADLVEVASQHFPLPDVVIYLHADPKFLHGVRRLSRIESGTGPKSDADTPLAWIEKICALNEHWFARWDKTPLIAIDVEKTDLLGDSKAFPSLVNKIRRLIQH